MSKKTYEALPGVEWVNGQRAPQDRRMKLSSAEAKFDLAQGRIRLIDNDQPAQAAARNEPKRAAKPNQPAAKS